MEFAEKLNSLSIKIRQQGAPIQTEEAAKNAFVMPFILEFSTETFGDIYVVGNDVVEGHRGISLVSSSTRAINCCYAKRLRLCLPF